MSFLQKLINGVTRLNDFLGRWIALLVFVMSALLLFEVICRYAFDSPTVWTTELTQFLFAIYSIMAGGYVMAHRGHVNVDLLYSHIPVRGQAIIDIFTAVVFYIFILAFLYFATSMAWESIQGMETSYSAWNPPVWPVKAFMPIAVFLVFLQGTVKLLRDIAVAINPNNANVLKDGIDTGEEEQI
ncbi:TRAP transporter small permease subunit [Alloalcanivorax sp. C16-2]|uniref:TRAP transporter small permease subunit n=1 Tax=Alloalcanivorax TaxID=3020832 RepID=UPI0019322843|nr:TRAP transporter small permease subunit [Alloalcanivorax marinus]MBL7252230.1 TRAP transporter small permease subunit [Alloalcanivorax marinus]